MTIGLAVIFAGYLATRQPDGQKLSLRRERARTGSAVLPGTDPALAYIEQTLLPLDEAEIALRCQEWSIETDPYPWLRRDEAVLAWQLRTHLNTASQVRFDALSVPTRRQIVVLHDQVLTAKPVEIDAIARLLPR